MWLVGQTSEQLTASAIVWSLVLIGIVLAAFVAVSLVRRWAHRAEPPDPAGFTLGDLRQLYKNGNLSQEEFERAKARILAGARHEYRADASETDGDKPGRHDG